MPTPVGPAPPDPDDPDLWDWGEWDAEVNPRRRMWQVAVVTMVVVGLVLLLIVNIL